MRYFPCCVLVSCLLSLFVPQVIPKPWDPKPVLDVMDQLRSEVPKLTPDTDPLLDALDKMITDVNQKKSLADLPGKLISFRIDVKKKIEVREKQQKVDALLLQLEKQIGDMVRDEARRKHEWHGSLGLFAKECLTFLKSWPVITLLLFWFAYEKDLLKQALDKMSRVKFGELEMDLNAENQGRIKSKLEDAFDHYRRQIDDQISSAILVLLCHLEKRPK